MSRLVVMGSGETAPTMVKTHRQVFEDTALARGRTVSEQTAVMLDTTFGFQLNADDLVTKTVKYFADSVGAPVSAARWRRADAPLAERERALSLLARADWAFAGPGSPTYALTQWRGTAVPDALLDVVRRGGTLVLGSAAACTIGTHAIPVYEVYKVGTEPHWEPGLDLFDTLTGIKAALIPHFDNNEGGSYDTRFCYLGEPRLARPEAELPPEIGVLGVDEHTAMIIDLDDRSVRVTGNGTVTVRSTGRSRAFPTGTQLSLDQLAALLRGDGFPAADGSPSSGPATEDGPLSRGLATEDDRGAGPAGDPAGGPSAALPSLAAEAEAAQTRFESCLAGRDIDGCVTALLDLESAIVAWRADTDQNDDEERARRILRALVVRLGELAEAGARDPHEMVGPFVDLALRLRQRARAAKDFASADLVRSELSAAGVEVRDAPDGATWLLHDRRPAPWLPTATTNQTGVQRKNESVDEMPTL